MSDPVSFITNFRFGPEHRTGDPMKDLAQDTFNQIKDKCGHNAAWTWALANAWNWLGGELHGGLRVAMDSAGISREDQNRIINTYGSSKAKYFKDRGLVADNKSMGTFFSPNPEIAAIKKVYDTYHLAYTNAYSKWKASGYQGTFVPPPR